MNDSASFPIRRRGRPAKRVADRFETREALIRCGVAVLTEKGFAATGIDEILKQLGVPKGSFYHYFASKEAFGQAVIAAYADYFARKLERCLTDGSRLPLQRLANFIDEACAGMARYQFRRGCLIGNLGQEMAVLPEAFREQLEAVFQDWQRRVADCLQQAQQRDQLSETVDCQQWAAFFWMGWEGAVLRAKLVANEAPLRQFAQVFFAALSQ